MKHRAAGWTTLVLAILSFSCASKPSTPESSSEPTRRPRLREAGHLPWASPGDEPPPLAVDARGRAAALLYHRDASIFFRWGGGETASIRLPGRPIALLASGDTFYGLVEAAPAQRAIIRVAPDGGYVRLGAPGPWNEIRPSGAGLLAVRDGREVVGFDAAGAERILFRAPAGATARVWMLAAGGAGEIALFRPQDGVVEVVEGGSSHEVGRLILGAGPPVWHRGRLYWVGPSGRDGSALYRWHAGRTETWIEPWPIGPLGSAPEGLLAFRTAPTGWEGVFLSDTGAVVRSFPLAASWRPRIVRAIVGNPSILFLDAEKRVPYLLLVATQKEDGGILAELGNPNVRRVALAPDGSVFYASTRRGIDRVELR